MSSKVILIKGIKYEKIDFMQFVYFRLCYDVIPHAIVRSTVEMTCNFGRLEGKAVKCAVNVFALKCSKWWCSSFSGEDDHLHCHPWTGLCGFRGG